MPDEQMEKLREKVFKLGAYTPKEVEARKEKGKHYGTFIGIGFTIILLGFIFYWYEWRPTQIKKDCSKLAKEESVKMELVKGEGLTGLGEYQLQKSKTGAINQTIYKEKYEICLKDNGL